MAGHKLPADLEKDLRSVQKTIGDDRAAESLLISAKEQNLASTLIQSHYRCRATQKRMLSLKSVTNRDLENDAIELLDDDDAIQQQTSYESIDKVRTHSFLT